MKLVFSFYQIVDAIPTVYGVTMPAEHLRVFEAVTLFAEAGPYVLALNAQGAPNRPIMQSCMRTEARWR